jgi:nitrate reductase molybdenum cofactor assembly chaperone NarJ/NarW
MTRRAERRRAERATVYKLCSLGLQYPDEELLAARGDLAAAASELHRGPAAGALARFFAWFEAATPLQLAQHYVQTFDLHKRSALYLTFYSLGDRRDRGLALVRLKKLYRAAGLPLEGSELPDYLPVMLEFAAAAAPEQGDLLLAQHRPALELVRLALHDQETPYAHVLDAACAQLGGLSARDRLSLDRLVAEGPPQELVGLEPFAPPEVMPGTGAQR